MNRRTFDSPIFEEFQTDALRSGDFFGEEVLFGEKTRIFSAVSTNDNTLVLRLTKDVTANLSTISLKYPSF